MTEAKATLLKDYAPFPYKVTEVDLTFRLSPRATRVLARIGFAPNPERPGRHDLFLHGETLKLIAARIDGKPLAPDALAQTVEGLTIAASALPPGPFQWEAEVEIDPEGNTALEGLYMSGGIYCTQCEAEGFRKITFYPDRPDVMAPFKVRIESDKPVLLSNGNPAGTGTGWAEWSDPSRLSFRAGRRRPGQPARYVHHPVGPRSGAEHLGARRRSGPLRLCDGRAETVDEMGRRCLWPRIRPGHLQHCRGR